MNDHIFIRRCIELAERGRGQVGNAPLVGSVLVRDGKAIAEGAYMGFGMAHAERTLLEAYEGPIEDSDVLYVNLEPCCHHGKTPPCTDIIIERGIKHVVFGMFDPDERVAGKGTQALKKAGIEVRGPVLAEDCAWQNRGYISVRTKQRPWVTLKMAQTRAGQVSHSDGSPMKITSEEQDIWAHTFLRARHDAILVGVGTVEADDPKLNTRFVQDAPKLYRVILDPALRIDEKSYILTNDPEMTILIVREDHFDPEKFERIAQKGVFLFPIDYQDAAFDWAFLWHVLTTPIERFKGITSLLVEGGPKTWQLFKENGFVDQEILLVEARF